MLLPARRIADWGVRLREWCLGFRVGGLGLRV